jgi:hypothetical protein
MLAGGQVKEDYMANLVHNERVKYAATFFNNIGIASIAVGAILPILRNPEGDWWQIILSIGCAVFGFVCSSGALNMLGLLKD